MYRDDIVDFSTAMSRYRNNGLRCADFFSFTQLFSYAKKIRAPFEIQQLAKKRVSIGEIQFDALDLKCV